MSIERPDERYTEFYICISEPISDSDEYIPPVPVAAQSKAYVFGRSPAEMVDSNSSPLLTRQYKNSEQLLT